MSKFYLPSSSISSTTSPGPLSPDQNHSLSLPNDPNSYDDSEEDTLPYPKPLVRSAFLAPDFDPQEYLSSLKNRHQTLEDLRSELRTRVQDLSKELVDLVNDEYEEFLSVGSTVQGGGDRVEQVRLGVLAFERDVQGVRDAVDKRRKEVQELGKERQQLRRKIALGRKVLDLDERMTDLEGRLFGVEEEDDEMDLTTHAGMYYRLKKETEELDHPFVHAQQARMERIRKALLLDLGAALKTDDRLTILSIYRDLDEVPPVR